MNSDKAWDYLECIDVTDHVVGPYVDMGLPIEIIAAMIEVESGGSAHAMRYEPNYQWLVAPGRFVNRNNSLETEMALQRFSYGLLQIMGANARALGMEMPLIRLTDPFVGLRYALKHLIALAKKYDYDWLDVISSYNQGSPRKKRFDDTYKNQTYVDKVSKNCLKYGLIL